MDWVIEQRRRKWRWVGHVARRKDGRWSNWLLTWIPVRGGRARGRPVTRWEDVLVQFMRRKGAGLWRELAQGRDAWGQMEDEFARKDATAY